MACANCDHFNTEGQRYYPGQFGCIAEKVRAAVAAGTLLYNSFESDRELIGQPAYLVLDLSVPFPDVMRYTSIVQNAVTAPGFSWRHIMVPEVYGLCLAICLPTSRSRRTRLKRCTRN